MTTPRGGEAPKGAASTPHPLDGGRRALFRRPGGLGSTTGALIGALLVGLMSNYVGFLLPAGTQFASIFLMVAVLLWRPQGVYPVANR